LPHENYRDWKLRDPWREKLHYSVRIAGKPIIITGVKICSVVLKKIINSVTKITNFPHGGKSDFFFAICMYLT
jgi:hypothetical protein